MKKINLFLAGFFLICFNIYCGNAQSANKSTPEIKFAQIKFKNESVDLGKIPAKINAHYDFVFSNTGNSPLKIIEARGGCHCVQAKWPETSINPGDSAVINVEFDPTGVTGAFIRELTVRSNAKDSSVLLKLNGEVLPASK